MNPYIPNTLQGSSNNRDQANFARTSYGEQEVSHIAIVTRAISPGKTGRLKYAGTYWNARSVDNAFIPTDTEVYLIMRRGNTWFVSASHLHAIQQVS